MKTNSLLFSSTIIFFLVFSGCKEKSTEPDDSIAAKPVVKVTNTDYKSSFYDCFPDTLSLKSISSAYSGDNYSEKKKSALNEYMRQQVKALGEDLSVFDNVISLSGCNSPGEFILPTYAEKAKYNGKDVWIMQVTYSMSAPGGTPGFGHYRCLAFGVEKFDTLAYVGCR